jgi:hypothetical protein
LHEIIKLFLLLLLQDSSAIQKRRIPWQNIADGNNNRRSTILRQSGKRRIPFQNVADGNNNRLLEDSSAIRKEEDSISERCRRQQQSATRRFLSNPEEDNSISERCRRQQQSAA